MLRWLVPENGQPEKRLPDEQLRQKIRVIVETGSTPDRLQHIAVSRTAGIWRIKRSKIILGFLDGLGIKKLVTKVRVPPESIIRCLNRFAQKGLKYFDHPERKPTMREAHVEQMLAFLEVPPDPGPKQWRLLKVRYIGHDFMAGHISKIRKLIESHLKRVVNNAPFLIMPWIYSPNLASRILGGIAKAIYVYPLRKSFRRHLCSL